MVRHIQIFSLLLCLFLSACVSAPTPRRLNDGEVANLNPAQLCALKHYNDERINKRMESEEVDCTPSALVCHTREFKKGTAEFKKCQKDYGAQVAMSNKRIANPDWAYCRDKGFKDGTHAMATCQNGWQQRRAQEVTLQQQQYTLQAQQAELRRMQMQQSLQNLYQQLDRQNAPSFQQPRNMTCDQNRFGTVNCRQW